MNTRPYEYQEKIAEDIITRGDFAVGLFMKMGCVTGDNIVNTNRGPRSVKRLYELWQTDKNYKVKSLVNGRFAYMPIAAVTYTGEKECIKITTDKVKYTSFRLNELCCTLDHPVYTSRGWVKAGDLKIGDKILANGKPTDGCIHCGRIDVEMTGPQAAKYKGYCKDCYHHLRSSYKGIKEIWVGDYKLLVGTDLQDHPSYYTGHRNGVYEHVLIMEKKIGRYLKPEEVVHHIDGNPRNNHPDNLYLCKNQSEHAKIHSEVNTKNLAQFNANIDYISTNRGTRYYTPHEVTITNIQNIGIKKVYDISINDASIHNFVCSDIIVHNTGKTITSLRIFEKLWEANAVDKILVVCLKCKIQDWKDEIENQWKFPPQHEVINFESIWRAKRADYYKSFVDNRTMIIIDESHKMKGVGTKVTKYLTELKTQTKYKLILTGTPQSQQYIDYYPQMKFIDAQDYDMPYKRWESIYVKKELVAEYGPWHYEIAGYNHEDVLKEGIAKKAYYHNYESTYEKPIEIFQDIEHSKDAIKFQKDRVWRDPDPERCEDVIADNQFALRSYLRQSLSGFIKNYDIQSPKEEWLANFLEITQDRVVIFTNFVREIEKIDAVCKKLGKPTSYYYGAKKDLTAFKENENGVAIVNYASGATGINDLCIANIGVFYSPTDGDYILFQQARARLDRIGQTKQPIFYYLQTKGSIEKAIYSSLKKGENFDKEMFDEWLKLQK